MTVGASAAIIRHEMRIALSDPGTVVYMVVMPLLMAALVRSLYAGVLQAQGVEEATGTEFAKPGRAVAFAAFSSGYAGFADHGELGLPDAVARVLEANGAVLLVPEGATP